MGPNEFPALAELKGKSLITTDGTTLLGADDKAGVAEIMTMAAFFLAHPEVKHGDICIAFTPDEEVGCLLYTSCQSGTIFSNNMGRNLIRL